MVSREHINYLVQASISRAILNGSDAHRWFHADKWNEIRPGDYNRANEVGQMLWDENVKSVQFRYGDESIETLPGPGARAYVFVFKYDFNFGFDATQIIKACDCLNYQSCEHEAWEASEAKAFVDSLRCSAWHRLPGYDRAAWEIA